MYARDLMRCERLREQVQCRHLSAEHRVEFHVLRAADEAAVKHLQTKPTSKTQLTQSTDVLHE